MKDWKCKVNNMKDFVKGYEKGKAEAEKMHLEFVEKVKNKILIYFDVCPDRASLLKEINRLSNSQTQKGEEERC